MNTPIQTPDEDFDASGYLLFMPFAQGSKSQSLRPFLVTSGQSLRLHFEGDNPFENNTLRPYHTKLCQVKGKRRPEGFVSVQSIEVLADPVIGNELH